MQYQPPSLPKLVYLEPEGSYDPLGQHAQLLVPLLLAERPGVIDFKDYRRNPLLGPPGTDQLDYINQAADHLIECLGLELVTKIILFQKCGEILNSGCIASVPALLERLSNSNSSELALKNRLLGGLDNGEDNR